jgi:hypothetical protein
VRDKGWGVVALLKTRGDILSLSAFCHLALAYGDVVGCGTNEAKRREDNWPQVVPCSGRVELQGGLREHELALRGGGRSRGNGLDHDIVVIIEAGHR